MTTMHCRKTTPLRKKMTDLMVVKNLSLKTQQSYLYSVTSLSGYYHRSPDQLDEDDIQQYLIYLVKDRKLAANSCRLQLQGMRFFYLNVLGRPPRNLNILYPKREIRLPDLLTRGEALSIVNAPENIKHQCQLKLCYACGLRVSEVLGLRIKDIDGERQQLKVEQGKGMKDRLVPLPAELLHQLRIYWQHFKPKDKLFYVGDYHRPMSPSSVQKLFTLMKKCVGIDKDGGIHALRYAFATHQLEAGLPLHLLQRWLGHKDIRTTMRYVHWVPSYQDGMSNFADLLRAEKS